MQDLLKIMRRLRAPDGCPWDREQSHESLRPYLLEEAAETVDAIAQGDTAAMTEELGDVLLQVAFHAVIAEEEKSFSYEAIEQSIVDKLVRRHPHVFADTTVDNAEEVVTNWHAIKAQEKADEKPKTATEQVPQSLPTLMRAAELSKKLEWPAVSQEELLKHCEALEPTEQSVGALLLAVATYAKSHKLNPELALRDAMSERLV